MRRDDRGSTSAEFALVVPLFFVLVAIAAYFAWQMFTESQLERAAQRAARYAAVPTTDGTYNYSHCDVVGEVNDQLTAFSVASSGVTVRDSVEALPQATCPDETAAGQPSGYVRVAVTHVLDNPFSNMLTFLLRRQKPMTITASGEAHVEDVR